MAHDFSSRRGFTLIEAALVTAIVGFGVVGMLQLLAVGTDSNQQGTELTTGLNLARNIRELTVPLAFADPDHPYSWDIYNPPHWGAETGETVGSYNDLDDLDGKVFSPPIDARRQPLPDFPGWSQRVSVRSVNPDWLSMWVPNATSPAVRIVVTVSRNGRNVCSMDWVALAAEQ